MKYKILFSNYKYYNIGKYYLKYCDLIRSLTIIL